MWEASTSVSGAERLTRGLHGPGVQPRELLS